MKVGIKNTGDYCCYSRCRYDNPPEELVNVIEPIVNGKADFCGWSKIRLYYGR